MEDSQCTKPMSKRIAIDFFTQLYAGDAELAVSRYCANDYVEHQATARFSRDGLTEYAIGRRTSHPGHEFVIHRAIADRDFVFLHVEERLGGGVIVARGELFRVLGGQIAEHWSAHVVDKTPRRNPHGTFDGPQVDSGKTTGVKHAHEFDALDRRGFGEFELATFYRSRTPDYIQHSPTGKDTVQGLVDVLAMLRERGIRMTIDIKRTLAEGDFLVCHRLYRTQPPFPEFRTINVFDLFRLADDGRAAEHWDVMEEVASEADLERLF